MSRVAVCLLFIAIFQYGHQQSLQANDSSSKAATDESKADIEEIKVTKAPVQEEQVKISTSKSKNEKPTESNVKESTKPTTRRSSPFETLKGLTISGTIIPPIQKASETISETVSKGVHGVKAMADGAYNFLRDAVEKIF